MEGLSLIYGPEKKPVIEKKEITPLSMLKESSPVLSEDTILELLLDKNISQRTKGLLEYMFEKDCIDNYTEVFYDEIVKNNITIQAFFEKKNVSFQTFMKRAIKNYVQ